MLDRMPTSREGPLLGVVRPAWIKVTESEQRVTWLNKMVKRGLCVNDIEAYIKCEHEKLRSEKFIVRECERDIMINLMNLKLKDEKRNLVEKRGIREQLRKWLKRELGGSRRYESLIKRLRLETNQRKVELQEKYNRKLDHLESSRNYEINEKRKKEVPNELSDYVSCKVFDDIEFRELEVEIDNNVKIGEIELDKDEQSILVLNPKFGVMKKLNKEDQSNKH